MKSIGDYYEKLAVRYLLARGAKILCRNYHSRVGEIDIIASKDEQIYFFEVRYRSVGSIQNSAESISNHKLSKIYATISIWLAQNDCNEENVGGIYAILFDKAVSKATNPTYEELRNIVKIVEIGV